MRKPSIIAAIILMSCIQSSLEAAVGKITEYSRFGPEAVKLHFLYLEKEGINVRDVFSAWGIGLVGTSKIEPVIKVRQLYNPLVVTPILFNVPVVLNGKEDSDSSGKPLIVDLPNPAQRFGVFLAGGNSGTKAELTAFDAQGNNLGTISESGLPGTDSWSGKFVGIEDLGDGLIRKVRVDYGATAAPEELRGLAVEYASRPTFRLYIPQVADGTLSPASGASRLRTQITISNTSQHDAKVGVRFLNPAGNPLEMSFLGGQQGSQFDFSLPTLSTFDLVTQNTGAALKQGYALIESDVPIDAVGFYRIFDELGDLKSEAGIAAVHALSAPVATVSGAELQSINTGVAMVNDSDSVTDVTLVYTPTAGQIDRRKTFELPAHGQIAVFVTELFPDLTADEKKGGTLLLLSANRLAVTVIRTVDGLPASSLPVSSVH